MKRTCHGWAKDSPRRTQVAAGLRHARLVTDPQKLAQLSAQAEKQKRFAGCAYVRCRQA